MWGSPHPKYEIDFGLEVEKEWEKMEEEFGKKPGLLVVENPNSILGDENEIDVEETPNGEGKQDEEIHVKRVDGPREPRNDDGSGGDLKNGVVKCETWETMETFLGWRHQNTVEFLQDLVKVVPMDSSVGSHCGACVEWLTSEREQLEWELESVRRNQEGRTVKICSSQVVEETLNGDKKRTPCRVQIGENENNQSSQGPGEILQTVTVPLNEVRAEIEEWKGAMMKEYNSLVHETKAIEPVKLGDLEQESVEFVPGKLVTVRKAGPDGGKKKCRAVVCGNLLQGDLDPSPGSPYASGADGVLIRAALAFSVEKRWGIETTDIRTAFLHAPRPKKDDVREVIVVPQKSWLVEEFVPLMRDGGCITHFTGSRRVRHTGRFIGIKS